MSRGCPAAIVSLGIYLPIRTISREVGMEKKIKGLPQGAWEERGRGPEEAGGRAGEGGPGEEERRAGGRGSALKRRSIESACYAESEKRIRVRNIADTARRGCARARACARTIIRCIIKPFAHAGEPEQNRTTRVTSEADHYAPLDRIRRTGLPLRDSLRAKGKSIDDRRHASPQNIETADLNFNKGFPLSDLTRRSASSLKRARHRFLIRRNCAPRAATRKGRNCNAANGGGARKQPAVTPLP